MRITKIASMILVAGATICTFAYCTSDAKDKNGKQTAKTDSTGVATEEEEANLRTPVDTAKYNELVKTNANGDTTGKWPVKNDVVPIDGAILPYNRIVAYYGNLYSKKMGALGEYAPKEMWKMLDREVVKWNKADSVIKAIPAIHFKSSHKNLFFYVLKSAS